MLKRFGMVASALALLAVALAGCKNGMLGEDEATVNGLRGVGSRMARVTVTNFEDDGRLRTIAADQPDVKAAGQWYFVASGVANTKTAAPRFVGVDTTSGRVNLADLGAAVWNVTITMFDKTELDRLIPGLDTANPAHAEQALTTHMAAAVLSGAGTVDLIRGDSDVRITLTSRGIVGNANVNLTVILHSDDRTAVGREQYQVRYGLYDKVTGAEIMVGTGNNANSVDTQAHGVAAAVGGYGYTANANVVPAGQYVFKVIINPDRTGGKGPWQWSDIINIENNLDITKTLDLPAIIGKSPTPPEKFAIFWDSDKVNYASGEYTVHLAWDRKSYNEDYFKVQFVDITGKLNKDFDSYTGNGTGPTLVAGTQVLWNDGITADPDFADLAKYTLDKNFQSHVYPIYAKDGGLLAGNTSADFILETGKVYAVRICASNVNGDSDWAYPDSVEPTNTVYTTWKQANTNAVIFQEVALSLFTVTYDLSGHKLVQDGQPMTSALGTSISAVAFDPATPTTIRNLAYSAQNAQGYLLYTDADVAAGGNAGNADGKNIPWDSWIARQTGQDFKFGAADYDDYKNIVIRPNSLSGGSATLGVDSAGTYKDQLTSSTLFLLQAADDTTTPGWTTDHTLHSIGLKPYTGNAAVSIEKHADGKFIINTDAVNPDYLYFDVGADAQNMGKVEDVNGNQAELSSVTYSIVDSTGYTLAWVEGKTNAFLNLDSLSGDFFLKVVATSRSGVDFSFEASIVVKDKDASYP